MKKFTLRIPDNLAKAVAQVAQTNEQTKTEVIREAIKYHLRKNSHDRGR